MTALLLSQSTAARLPLAAWEHGIDGGDGNEALRELAMGVGGQGQLALI